LGYLVPIYFLGFLKQIHPINKTPPAIAKPKSGIIREDVNTLTTVPKN
jgi:hypothetical protein